MSKKSKGTSGKLSNGGRQQANLNHEAKRQTKFKAKREAGKAYEYKPNPFKKGTEEYFEESRNRAAKNVDHKTPVARWTSVMAKLDNELNKKARLMKEGRK